MTLEIKKNAAETIIQIVGRLDTITAPTLDKTIHEEIGDTNNLILDLNLSFDSRLSLVTKVDSES